MRIKPNWGISTLLWIVVVISAFFAGRAATMEPVLVANKDLTIRRKIVEGDFRVEQRLSRNIPTNAIRSLGQVEGQCLLTTVEKDGLVSNEDVSNLSFLISVTIPPDHKVINVRLGGIRQQTHSFATCYLEAIA